MVAWWQLVDCLKRAKARAPYVAASKILAAKRLDLIPLEDSYVGRVYGVSRRNIWKVIHCLVRDPYIRQRLELLRQQVSSASQLTIHRILDIIAWRKYQGDCCKTSPHDL